jgi:hypothetical protein
MGKKDEAFEMIREADVNGDNKVSFPGKHKKFKLPPALFKYIIE